MHIYPLQTLLPVLDRPVVAGSFFGHFKEFFAESLQEGRFRPQLDPAVYIYEIERATRLFRGLIAAVSIEDYLEGHIKKHELTLLAKEDMQQQLFLRQKAMIKPVLTTYPSCLSISEWVDRQAGEAEPVLEVKIEPAMEVHRLFAVKAEAHIRELQQLFLDEVHDAYIADGHHRFAAAATLYKEGPSKPFSRVMCAFFDARDLEIHSFNRIVTGLNGLAPDQFLERLSSLCMIQQTDAPLPPLNQHEFMLVLDQQYYYLRWKQQALTGFGSNAPLLDVHLLNEYILRDILGISDVRKDPRIAYVEGPSGIEGLKKNAVEGAIQAAFLLFPISFDQLKLLCDQAIMLPPKSTWFEPRMKTGLIVCPWQESFFATI